MNLNYNIVYDNFKLYIKKFDREFSKIFKDSVSKENFIAKMMLGIYMLNGKNVKNKLLNIVNAIQILSTINDIEDEMIYGTKFTGKKTLSKYDMNSVILTSQYYYNIIFKIFYENCPETIGIVQRIIENNILHRMIQNKNRYSLNSDIEKYINTSAKKWIDFFELSSLISAYIARLNKDKTKISKDFATAVAIAYSIEDDIRNLEFKIKMGISNLPTILMLKEINNENVIDEICKMSKGDYNIILENIKQTNSIKYSKDIQNKYINEALKTINDIDGKQSLKKLLQEYFVEKNF